MISYRSFSVSNSGMRIQDQQTHFLWMFVCGPYLLMHEKGNAHEPDITSGNKCYIACSLSLTRATFGKDYA